MTPDTAITLRHRADSSTGQFADPAAHTVAVCDAQMCTCDLQRYVQPAIPQIATAGPSPSGMMTIVRGSLGTQHVNGMELIGTRETQTSAAVSPRKGRVPQPFRTAALQRSIGSCIRKTAGNLAVVDA